MSWASRRRFAYISIFIVVALLIIGWVGFKFFYEPPTCFDGKQNGDEAGIDCGGVCERVCSFEAIEVRVLWSRFFEVAPGVYNAVALLDNPNVGALARAVDYSLKLYDSAGVLVYERKGEIDIPPENRFAVFESNIVTGERIPRQSFFEFQEAPNWQRAEGNRLQLKADNILLTNEEDTPRVTAQLKNKSLEPVEDIEAIAILFNESTNAIAASRTVIDFLPGDGETELIFTWPRPFDTPVAQIEIFPQALSL